jgi:peptidoglycan/LPS O-acetylase OafA/YrhL
VNRSSQGTKSSEAMLKASSVRLADAATGRNNNLNLIRMVAATAVLVSHAWPIALGPGTPEPLHALTGYSLGGLAVFAFFTISGFLIAASYDRSRTYRQFLLARTLRLFPALVVSLLLVAFVMGPLVTTLPLMAYLTDPGVYTFMVRNTALIVPQYTLPGVFETNPYPTVEGSIWTLVHEVACYIGVFLLGVAGLLRRRQMMAALFLAYLAGWLAVPVLGIGLHPRVDALRELSLPFALGAALYLWRDRIVLSPVIAMGLIAVTVLARDTVLQGPATVTALGYTLFWLAYVPGGAVRRYNLIGDYSYGIYIYAFPIQGLMVWLLGPMTPMENILWSLPPTLAVSVLSWHIVEKPALSLMRRGQEISHGVTPAGNPEARIH